MAKFLIIRFSSIGDIVLTTPVIRCLKLQVENAEVHFLTKKSFVTVVSDNKYIDKIHTIEKSTNEVIEDLKNENFDYIIDLHHNLRSFLVKRKLKVLSFSFDKLNFQKWLIVTFHINKLPKLHIVDRYFETVRLFDVNNDKKGLDFFISNSNNIDIQTLPEAFCGGYVAFVIGAKHNTKRLPKEKIVLIISKTDLPTLLIGGKEDFDDGEYIVQQTQTVCLNTCGKYNLQQSASLVNQSRVVVTHDTGLMHIAAAFKKKIVSIWGNTIPEFGMYPYQSHTNSVMFETSGLKCRPCSKIGYKKCPKKHFKCMNDLNEERIVSKVKMLF